MTSNRKILTTVVFFLVVGFASSLLISPESLSHLGAEYHNISKSIYRDQLFANPFEINSGATAWMPPVLSYFLAFCYYISLGNETGVVVFATVLQAAGIAATIYFFLKFASNYGLLWSGVYVTCIALYCNFHLLFQLIHDTGLLLVVNGSLWIGLAKIWNGPLTWKSSLMWGAFGGLSALCSPVVGVVWATVTCFRWFATDVRSARNRHLLATTIVSIAIVAPWIARNYLVFDRLVPIKSNGMFELWQSQCADDDGIFDHETAQSHPYLNFEVREEYKRLGEIAFIESKAAIVKRKIQETPRDYFDRVISRLIAATVYYTPFNRLDPYNKPWFLFFKRLLFPLPVIALCVILSLAPKPMPIQVSAAISIWLLSLLPYVLISYYERYATPLLLMKLIVVFYAWYLLNIRLSRITFRTPED
jgi:hypothetical protein